MLDIDRNIIDFIDELQQGNYAYKLFTTIPDFFVDANFRMISNDNFLLSFTLQPEEHERGLSIDYFFQRPFLLVAEGMQILVHNINIVSSSQNIDRNAPCSFNIEVNGFKGDTDETLWEQSMQSAYFRYDENMFSPNKSGIRFDITTNGGDNGFYNALLIKVNDIELLFYYERITPKYGYYIFRSKKIVNSDVFQLIVNSTIVAFGFLNGFHMSDTIYYFAIKEVKGKGVLTYRYENSKQSFNTNAPIIDSGFYDTIPLENLQLSSQQFNNLVNILYTNEEYMRSALLLINAGKLKDCAKASLGAVALETISKKVGEKYSTNQIIEDIELSKELRKQLDNTLRSFSGKLDEEQLRIISVKLNQINSKTNASKLEDAFHYLGISLDEEEKYCISCRNLFLHGNLPRRKKDFWMTDTEILDVVGNRLVMLSSILLLSMVNYTGMVIDKGMTDVTKWRMIRLGQKIQAGNCLREIVLATSSDSHK